MKKSPKQLREDFIEKYKGLCDEFKLQIVGYPVWLRDENGSWLTTVQYTLDTLNEDEKKLKEEDKKPVV